MFFVDKGHDCLLLTQDNMTVINYSQLLKNALNESTELSSERARIDARLLKLQQFIYAAINLLPEEERSMYQAEVATLASQFGNLTDSIREILKLATQRETFFTAAEVRDQLKSAGFDFSEYTSNPLASVNTILRRFRGDEVEVSKRAGVTVYKGASRSSEKEAEKASRRAIRFGGWGPFERGWMCYRAGRSRVI